MLDIAIDTITVHFKIFHKSLELSFIIEKVFVAPVTFAVKTRQTRETTKRKNKQ